MKDERAEHLDRLSRLCAFLCMKYEVPMPELELAVDQPYCDEHGPLYGDRVGNVLKIWDNNEAPMEKVLAHEFLHYAASFYNAKQTEAEIHKRALVDLEEFELWDLARSAVQPLRKYLRWASSTQIAPDSPS